MHRRSLSILFVSEKKQKSKEHLFSIHALVLRSGHTIFPFSFRFLHRFNRNLYGNTYKCLGKSVYMRSNTGSTLTTTIKYKSTVCAF